MLSRRGDRDEAMAHYGELVTLYEKIRSPIDQARTVRKMGTLHWQSMLAPAQTPKPVLETLFKAIQEAAKVPALQEAFGKQLVSVKPSESLAEAQTWLNGELASWRKTTSEVKIDLSN